MTAKSQKDFINDDIEKISSDTKTKKTWKMKHEKTGVIADVHPDERVNYFKGGYVPVKD